MFLFIIFLQFLGSLSVDPRAVAVNVETSFVFRPNDIRRHNSVINNIKALISSLEKHFRVDKPIYRTQNLDGELMTFFLNLGEKFLQQDDDYIRNFTRILKNVLETYYLQNELSTLFGNDVPLQDYVINNSLNKWHLLSAQNIRANIKEALETDDTIFHAMIQLADRFFNESDRKPLEEIITDLTGGNGERKDLSKIIKGAFHFIFLKKFKSLEKFTQVLVQNEVRKVLYGYNNLGGIDERKLDSDVKIKFDKEKEPEIPTTKKDTNEDKKVNEAIKEITDDLERIKREHMNVKKTKINSEERIKKEGEVLLKHVEKEIRRLNNK